MSTLSTNTLRWLATGLLVGAFAAAPAAAQTWGERLGYPKDQKVLLLHADDLGMCFEANDAGKRLIGGGHIQSGAVMVPCPWFDEMWNWYKQNPSADIGLHLTLTSEWSQYRWPPLADRKDVPGLVDPKGFLWKNVVQVAGSATPEEVEIELRAQIDRAISRGIRPGHLDTHMGTLYVRYEYTAVYMKLAQEYRIPAMVIEPTPKVIKLFRSQGYPISEKHVALMAGYDLPKLDLFLSMPSRKNYREIKKAFMDMVKGLEPGITEIIFHPATPSPAMRKITGSWKQRSSEARLFEDPEIKQFLKDQGVGFTNWKEMMRRFDAKRAGDAKQAGDAK